jgi:SAM-dependent methyltransferase
LTIANRDQAEHWNNSAEVGQWVTEQARYDVMLAPFTELLIRGATLGSGDTVLDVGCGCGATTLAAARAALPGHTLGVDLSVAMLQRARADAAAAGLTNIAFEQADAQIHPFEGGAFDVVISRFGIMFFADPVAAFTNLRRATRPGGRLAFVCWQPLVANEWLAVSGAALATVVPLPDLGSPGGPGMFAFADPGRVRDVLADAGWRGITIAERRTAILVGGIGTLDEAVSFLRNGSLGRTMLAGADSATQARAIDAVRTALAPHTDEQGVRLGAAVWLVTAQA